MLASSSAKVAVQRLPRTQLIARFAKIVFPSQLQAVRALSGVSEFTKIDPEKSKYVQTNEESKYAGGKHRSNALELIEQQPIIEVDGDFAVCDGGGGPLGHPLEYIQLAGLPPGQWQECIYCGLKYTKKEH
eukprot:CAMPEP_0118696858 /NCGR_PEP_ID=MMETSP0800-20121206/14119_1 /TAXON_ID=210618 ORGANISM="Striatella unipunctata, Strain CCMP2910" /NCGR_SAMPLE_ID=MMETSP0800 /ASSEMBLY_ACC=CAM_ASM_000638 /LENGTH=130 /DNA_ID=CAMNT_0006596095 /DNA_START=20 /DNA_END=412 /DNA_ORIENTATION=+